MFPFNDVIIDRLHSALPCRNRNLSNLDTVKRKKVSLLVSCPDFRGCNVHKHGVRDSKIYPVYQDVLISWCPDSRGSTVHVVYGRVYILEPNSCVVCTQHVMM